MIERSFILKDEMGLHARPAAMLMVRMLHVSSSVEIICGDRRADGKGCHEHHGHEHHGR